MTKRILKFNIIHDSDIPKYQQIVNAINDGISKDVISIGDNLPSVNSFFKDYKLSRDTVFKAYSILKEDGVIDAVPNKGYYVASKTKKVLLVLDTLKAYKEVLCYSFTNNLPDTVITDVPFKVPICWVLISEIFPNKIRSKAVPPCSCRAMGS